MQSGAASPVIFTVRLLPNASHAPAGSKNDTCRCSPSCDFTRLHYNLKEVASGNSPGRIRRTDLFMIFSLFILLHTRGVRVHQTLTPLRLVCPLYSIFLRWDHSQTQGVQRSAKKQRDRQAVVRVAWGRGLSYCLVMLPSPRSNTGPFHPACHVLTRPRREQIRHSHAHEGR